MRKNFIIAFLFLAMLFMACKKTPRSSACGTQTCTDLFAAVDVMFYDSKGNAITVKNYQVIDLRTQTDITPKGSLSILGSYTVTDDSYLKLLSGGGDDLQVTASNPTTNQTKVFTVKVSGGACACHVSKVSGPDTVTFN